MNSDEYRRELEAHRREEEDRARRMQAETPYSPSQMRTARMPWGCWAILVLVVIGVVRGLLYLFRRMS